MATGKKRKKKGSARPSSAKNSAGLNERQQRFVDAYLEDPNATKAAIAAGYNSKTAYSQGQRLLKNVEVSRALEQARVARSARTRITQDYVLENLDECLRKSLKEEEVLDAYGNPKGLFVYDSKGATKAVELMMKHLGMLVDRKEISGPKGGPIQIDDLMHRTEEELEAEIRALTGEVPPP